MRALDGKQAIIWDWNGTLLDDVSICVECMNLLLEKRQLPVLTDDIYRSIFTFPVKAYYEKAGFDFEKEDFKVPALEFIELYYNNIHRAKLFPEVHAILQWARQQGLYQTVLSAMEHQALETSLTEKGIRHYFNEVIGINDHYGRSKLDNGLAYMDTLQYTKDKVLLIGDSLHDLEVADALGVDCVLLSQGHQSRERLLGKTDRVIESLNDLQTV